MLDVASSSPASTQGCAPFTCSIVFEWENWHFCEAWRPAASLAQLRRQIEALLSDPHPEPDSLAGSFLARVRGPVEVVMAFDPTQVDEPAIRDMVARELPASPLITLVWHETAPDARYYEVKNEGARRATGDVLVFCDSDVVPMEGWLRHLVGGLSNPEATLVAGMTCVATDDFLNRVFAMTWLFPLATPPMAMHPHPTFHANNFAIRRDVFQHYYFPHQPERQRGQCVSLANQLHEDGHLIYRQNRARMDHPRPVGLGNIIARGLAAGNEVGYHLGPGAPWWKLLTHAGFGMAKRVAYGTRNIMRDRRQAGMPWWEVPAALAFTTMFAGLFAVGMVASNVAPATFRRYVRV